MDNIVTDLFDKYGSPNTTKAVAMSILRRSRSKDISMIARDQSPNKSFNKSFDFLDDQPSTPTDHVLQCQVYSDCPPTPEKNTPKKKRRPPPPPSTTTKNIPAAPCVIVTQIPYKTRDTTPIRIPEPHSPPRGLSPLRLPSPCTDQGISFLEPFSPNTSVGPDISTLSLTHENSQDSDKTLNFDYYQLGQASPLPKKRTHDISSKSPYYSKFHVNPFSPKPERTSPEKLNTSSYNRSLSPVHGRIPAIAALTMSCKSQGVMGRRQNFSPQRALDFTADEIISTPNSFNGLHSSPSFSSELYSPSLEPTSRCESFAIEFPRYSSEYQELEELGKGETGQVFKVKKILDEMTYAVKKTKKRIRGELDREFKLQEVYALATSTNAPNIVQYFDAWIENDTLFLRLEYCRGSVADLRGVPTKWSEDELCELTRQVSCGLHHLHTHRIAHMDMKMENIYITYTDNNILTYKIGDLGLVRSLDDTSESDHCRNDMEGDARYLCRSMLNSSKHLTAADVFSLGASVYELARMEVLPNNGDEWHAIRNGELTGLDNYTSRINDIIRAMMHPEPTARPSSFDILNSLTPYYDSPQMTWMNDKIRSYESEIHRLRELIESRNTYIEPVSHRPPKYYSQNDLDILTSRVTTHTQTELTTSLEPVNTSQPPLIDILAHSSIGLDKSQTPNYIPSTTFSFSTVLIPLISFIFGVAFNIIIFSRC